jgi:hypothetical protein
MIRVRVIMLRSIALATFCADQLFERAMSRVKFALAGYCYVLRVAFIAMNDKLYSLLRCGRTTADWCSAPRSPSVVGVSRFDVTGNLRSAFTTDMCSLFQRTFSRSRS